jgi:hypothetical protein
MRIAEEPEWHAKDVEYVAFASFESNTRHCKSPFNQALTTLRLDLFSSYGVNSTNIRIVSTFKPSSRIAFLPSSDCSNS